MGLFNNLFKRQNVPTNVPQWGPINQGEQPVQPTQPVQQMQPTVQVQQPVAQVQQVVQNVPVVPVQPTPVVSQVQPVQEQGKLITEPFSMVTDYGFKSNGRVIASGVIQTGAIKVGNVITIKDTGKTATLVEIQRFRKFGDVAVAGEGVGLILDGVNDTDLVKGYTLICNNANTITEPVAPKEVFKLQVTEIIGDTQEGLSINAHIIEGSLKTGDSVKTMNGDVGSIAKIFMFRREMDYCESGDNVNLIISQLSTNNVRVNDFIEK